MCASLGLDNFIKNLELHIKNGQPKFINNNKFKVFKIIQNMNPTNDA